MSMNQIFHCTLFSQHLKKISKAIEKDCADNFLISSEFESGRQNMHNKDDVNLDCGNYVFFISSWQVEQNLLLNISSMPHI